MKLTVPVIIEQDDGAKVVTEVTTLEREALSDETLGLTLAERKTLLAGVPEILTAQQAASSSATQAACPEYGAPRRSKGQRQIVIRSRFGTLRLDSPRLATCACQPAELPRSSSPLAERLPERTTPERRYLEATWAALLPFGVTVDVLEEVLPLQASHTAIHRHTQQVASDWNARLARSRRCLSTGASVIGIGSRDPMARSPLGLTAALSTPASATTARPAGSN